MTRLIFIILFFLVSLLSLFRAPAYYLWLLAILVTEFPLIFVGITIVLTGTGFWVRKYRFAGTILGIVTIVIFFTPIMRAYWVAGDIKQDMAKALNTKPGDETPFSFAKLFTVSGSDQFLTILPYRSIKYVSYPDTSLTLDYYPAHLSPGSRLVPQMDEQEYRSIKRPCVIVVHGGSWSKGDSQQLPELNNVLAENGYNVAAINYRLTPRYQTPAPVEDVEASMVYLRKHADALHIDTNNFVLLGRSAGSQIALLAAYTLHEPSLRGVIDFYGPADMIWGYSIPSNPWIMNATKVMEDYEGGTYKQVPKKFFASSPIEFVTPKTIPTLIIHGKNDVLVGYEHSRRLNKKLDQNGIKHYWLKLPWATHGFDYNLNGPGGQLSTYAVETFLKAICPTAP